MSFLTEMTLRVRRLTILDVKLAQGAAIFLALTLVKLIPEIMNAPLWWFIALAVLCAIRRPGVSMV